MITSNAPLKTPGEWQVYILLTSDQLLYTGITKDIRRRWNQHTTCSGAKFFYGRQPVALCYLEGGHDRSSATKREMVIKKMGRNKKWQLIIESFGPHLPKRLE